MHLPVCTRSRRVRGVTLGIRRTRHGGWGLRSRPAREGVEHGHLGVRDRVGVIVAVDLPDKRLPPIEIEPIDLVQRPLDEIDRLFMQGRWTAREAGFADDIRAARGVNDNEIVRGHGPEAHRIGRVRLARPLPLPFLVRHRVGVGACRPMHQAALGQDFQHFLHVLTAVLFGRGKGQLERRALYMIDKDVEVVRIDQRVLRRRVEEIRRMPDDELIDRRAARNEHRSRATASASRTPGSLPRRRDGARIPGHHADV